MKLAHIALRNISRNKRRSLLSGIAIAVASMSMVMLYSLMAGMQADLEYNQETYYMGAVRVRNEEFTKHERINPMHLYIENSTGLIEEIRNLPETGPVSPRITFPSRIYLDGSEVNALGVGIDFTHENEFQPLEEALREGRFPQMGENEALLGFGLAKKMGLGIGDKFTLLTATASRGTNAVTLTIVGLAAYEVAPMNELYFQVPLDRVQYLLRMDNGVQEILIKTADGYNREEAAEAVKTMISDSGRTGLETRHLLETSETIGLMDFAAAIYDVFGIFFFLLGSTVIINTTMMVIFERMREIGTLNAMGMAGKELVRLFFLEAFYISLIGAAVGVISGIGLTMILGKVGIDFTAAMEGVDFDISNILYPKLSIKSTIVVFFYSVIVSSLATFLPSRRASKIEPVEALRYV